MKGVAIAFHQGEIGIIFDCIINPGLGFFPCPGFIIQPLFLFIRFFVSILHAQTNQILGIIVDKFGVSETKFHVDIFIFFINFPLP